MSDALNYLIKAHPGRRGFSGRPQPAKNARRQQREYQAVRPLQQFDSKIEQGILLAYW
jgi:hypothetical protein